MEILEKLMGGSARVKAMRFFLLNPDKITNEKEVSLKTKISNKSLRKEINLFKAIGLIKQKRISIEVVGKNKRKAKMKRVDGYFLNPEFPYKDALHKLLSEENTMSRESVLRTLKSAGKIKLLLVSGIFIQQPEARVDILIVGDNLNRKVIDNKIKRIESELGRELTYAVFDTKEFSYRLSMYDKLIREILDFPHERIVDLLRPEVSFS